MRHICTRTSAIIVGNRGQERTQEEKKKKKKKKKKKIPGFVERGSLVTNFWGWLGSASACLRGETHDD